MQFSRGEFNPLMCIAPFLLIVWSEGALYFDSVGELQNVKINEIITNNINMKNTLLNNWFEDLFIV